MRLVDPAFRAIFEDSPVGICIVDKDLRVVNVNAAYCDMLGRTEAEVMASSIPEFTHPDDRRRDADAMPKLLSGEWAHYRAEKRYIRKDGSIVWARIVVTAVLEESGRLKHVFSMAQDISEERALRALLPRCPDCGRVKGPDGKWVSLDALTTASANLPIPKENCPDC
jgi:PAS domain S-box-containing protein